MNNNLKTLKTNYNTILARCNKALEYFSDDVAMEKLGDDQIHKHIQAYFKLEEYRVKNLNEIEKEYLATEEEILFGFKIK